MAVRLAKTPCSNSPSAISFPSSFMASDYSIHNPARHRYPLMDFVPPHSAFINGNQQEWASNADQVEAGYHKTTSNVPPVTSLLSSFTGRIRSIRVGFQMPTPSLARFILLCSLWYFSSAMSSNTGKVIMNQFRFPITLTFIQFAFVAGYCLLCTSKPIGLSRFRYPTRQILRNTFPMALFQVGGHIFSSMAISRIPVSTVHTIKVSLALQLHPIGSDSDRKGTFPAVHCRHLRGALRR